MPVRKIPKNYLGVTGTFSSTKNPDIDEFESTLEREYLILLDFDPSVESFEVQPVRVPVEGVRKGYVPDVLVKFLLNLDSSQRRPRLVEVKHTDDLARNAVTYAKKFEAAKVYANERGWEFCIVTEKDIRTPRLAHLKFLREYRNVDTDPQDAKRILDYLIAASGPSSSTKLLDDLAADDNDRLSLLPTLWAMVLKQQILVDMDKPLQGDVPIWLPGK